MSSIQDCPPRSCEQSVYWFVSQCLSPIRGTPRPSATVAIWPRYQLCWRKDWATTGVSQKRDIYVCGLGASNSCCLKCVGITSHTARCPAWWRNPQNLHDGGWSHRELSPLNRWNDKLSTDGRVSHTQPLTYHEVQGDIVPTWRIPACRSVLKEKMAQGATPC